MGQRRDGRDPKIPDKNRIHRGSCSGCREWARRGCIGCAYVKNNCKACQLFQAGTQRAGSAIGGAKIKLTKQLHKKKLQDKYRQIQTHTDKHNSTRKLQQYILLQANIYQFQIYFPSLARAIGVSNLNCPVCSLLHKHVAHLPLPNIPQNYCNCCQFLPTPPQATPVPPLHLSGLQFSFLQTAQPPCLNPGLNCCLTLCRHLFLLAWYY